MAENQRFFGDAKHLRPIPIRHVQIGMADATGFHRDNHVMDVRLRLSDLFDGQRRFEIAQDGRLHCVYLSEFRYDLRAT